MGEIKSTLDPVMERTRDMTLSDEEKNPTEAEKKSEGGTCMRTLPEIIFLSRSGWFFPWKINFHRMSPNSLPLKIIRSLIDIGFLNPRNPLYPCVHLMTAGH